MISTIRRVISNWTNSPFTGSATQRIHRAHPQASAPLLLEELEEIVLLNAVPDVTIQTPADDVFIGGDFTFSVAFDNIGSTEGYGPIIDLIFPVNGADGTNPALDDGIDIIGSATYLGAPVTTVQLTFGVSGEVDHPFLKDALGNPLKVQGNPGDKLVVAQLPFGSFTPGQPPASIQFSADMSDLADLGVSLDFKARGAFMFGNDPLDNTSSDPVILSDAATNSSLWTETGSIDPILAKMTKQNLAPESETATGPNFPRTYEIVVEIAEGQTLTDFNLTDLLPPEIVFLGNVVVTANAGASVSGVTIVDTPTTMTDPHAAPDNNLTINIGTAIGGAGNTGFTVTFDFYVNEFNAVGNDVIDPTSADTTITENEVSANFDWDPLDGRDPVQNNIVIHEIVAGPDDQLQNEAIAVQKGLTILTDNGAVGYSPGDVLLYTLDFQISDYFGFEDISITDILSDGLRLDGTFTPTLSVSEHGNLTNSGFAGANFTVAPVSGVDGSQTLSFRISDELAGRGGSFADGQLVGGAIPNGGTGGGPPPAGAPLPFGGTTGQITYRVVIQDQFDVSPPSGDSSVDQGDVLNNEAVIDGAVLNVDDLTANGERETDDTAADLEIVRGAITKTIYAVNGVIAGAGTITVAPGDVVTYRFTATLPNSDVEDLKFVDYLPLPVFSAGEVITLNNTHSTLAPTAGQAHFHVNDTFSGATGLSGIVPGLSTVTVGGENRVEFTYGDFDDTGNSSTTIDILFSVTVGDEPFADGLFLTNQVRQEEGSSFNTNKVDDAINQIILSEPVLNITKGVIATDNAGGSFTGAVAPTSVTSPGSAGYRFGGTLNSTNLDTTPLNANLSNIDAGDRVTFAIVVENTGTSRKGAFDVEVRDLLPAGFVIPGSGLNLTVTDGTGASVTYTNVGGGTGLFDLGIRLDDPGATPSTGGALQNDAGAIDGFNATDGRNIIVITYDLVAETSVEPNETISNTAILQNYAGVEGGTDHTVTDLTDNALVTTDTPTIDKVITATNQAHTLGNNVAIGEIITYTVTIDLTEGTASGVTFIDTLDRGLAFVGLTSIVTNDPGDVSWSGAATASFASVGVGADNAGRQMTINFGDITNTDTNNAVTEKITITYQAVVINGGSNDRGDLRNNDADWNWAGGNTVSDSAPNVTIVEPTLDIAKTITPATGDAGNTHAVTLVISHTAASDANAFNIAISDALPTGMTVSGAITVTPTAGVTGLVNTSAGNTISVAAASIPDGDTITITFNVTLDPTVQPNELITNTADVDWTSLTGDVTTTQSIHNTLGVERTSDPTDPGGAANDYTDSGSDDVRITSPLISKSLISTSISNSANANNQAVIGETAIYEVTITLPEGQTLDAAIVDTLDRGLHFVSLDSITRSNGNLTTTVGANDFSDVGSFGTSVTGTSATGEQLTINLGDLDNVADNAAGDTITLRYTVLIDNVLSNVGAPEAPPTLLNNAAEFTWDLFGAGQTTGTTSAANIEVIEPLVNVDKSVVVNGSGTTGDSGDSVQYTFVISHEALSDTDAFDVTFQDALPGVKLDGLTIASVTHSASGDLSALFEITPGEVLRTQVGSSFDLLEGQTVTIVVTGTLSGAVIPNETVTNTSSIAWTSLDGVDPNERTGAEDYNDSDSADITILPPVPVKSIVATSEAHTGEGTADTSADPRPLAVGEIVRYRLAVTLPEGTSPGYRIIDHLPSGMSLIDNAQVKVSFIADSDVGESVNLAGADNDAATPSFTLPAGRISTNGQDITFDLGDLINNDTDVNAETIIIEFNAIVNNAASNQDSTALDNNFDVEINGHVVATSNTVSGEVVEPAIVDVLKSLLSFNGNEVTYRLTFSNTGNAAAFDLNIDDAIPADLLLQTGTVSVSFSGVAPTFIDNSNAAALDIVIDQLAVGQVVTIDYTTTIVNPNTTLSNTVDVEYTSLPGGGTTGNPTGTDAPVGSERTGSDGPGVGLNNYADSSSLTLGALGDRVWYDIDNDGVQDGGEPGMAGVTVNMVFAGINGTFGDGDDVTLSTVTGTNGVYEFSGLPAGNYRVSVDTGTLPIGGLTESFDLNGIGTPSTTDTTLTAGQVRDNVDFGYTGKGSIGDRVWFDADEDGVQDAGEPGIDGVTVDLDVDYDQDGTIDFTLTTTTDANGNYIFSDLPIADYGVRVTQPAGYDQTFDADDGLITPNNESLLTLGDGENNTAQDFGYVGQGSIGDRVWLDVDGDGTPDGGEPGINGLTVQLDVDLNGDGTVDYTTTTTTGADGAYQFDKLPPGDYTITVTPPSGSTNTGDPDGGNDHTADVTLGVNEDNVVQDFGYQGTGSLGDRVWFDADRDGVQDAGEPGIGGVSVELDIDFDGDGAVDATLSTTTDASGNYLFEGLPAADYVVRVAPPVSFDPTFDSDGGLDHESAHTLGAGEDNVAQDFGYAGTGSIGDRVWFDMDGDGSQDVGEPGIGGVMVTLDLDLDGDGTTDYTTSTATDGDGLYAFNDLPVGDYTITVGQPGGTTQTFDNSGPTTDNASQLTLGTAENNTAQDFGYQGTGSIGDHVWFDADSDGVQDAGEPGIDGVTVELDVDLDGNGTVDVTLTDTTDANGNYLFENLPVGDYTVRVTQPAGYDQTFDANGALDNTSDHTLGAGENNVAQDFGYTGQGSIGDRVWFDADQDGIQDAGEPGFPNITVQLEVDLNGDGAVDYTTTATTDDYGNYLFSDLPPGAYTVSVLTTPAGGTQTFDADGGLDESSAVTLGVNEDNLDQDFGYKGSGSIGDRVWLDLDGDGTQDAHEPGMGGVTVTLNLDFTGDGVADYTTTTLTDPKGNYLFNELPVGDYTVVVAQPSGSNQTFDEDGPLDNASQHMLGADEDNIAQDFGYQGLGSISGRVAEDANGNKAVDPAEPGFSGKLMELRADINGDGIIDFTLQTLTGPNGEYTFGNLPAGEYRVIVVTPPDFREQSADPDGVNDNTTFVTLAPLENKVHVDYGYLSDYQYSKFFDPRNMRGDDTHEETPQQLGILPPLPDPMFTGITEPGATLVVALFDEDGGLLGEKMVQSDAAGNWQVSFHGTTLQQMPHSMRIGLTPAVYNTDIDSSFNLRRYFHNVGIGQIFAQFDGSVQKVFASLPSNVMMHMEQADLNPLGFGWHRHSYEQLASSPTPVEN